LYFRERAKSRFGEKRKAKKGERRSRVLMGRKKRRRQERVALLRERPSSVSWGRDELESSALQEGYFRVKGLES